VPSDRSAGRGSLGDAACARTVARSHLAIPCAGSTRSLRAGGHERLLGPPRCRGADRGGTGQAARRHMRDQGRPGGGAPRALVRPAPHDHRGRTRPGHPGTSPGREQATRTARADPRPGLLRPLFGLQTSELPGPLVQDVSETGSRTLPEPGLEAEAAR
jgi:hypothetical protein